MQFSFFIAALVGATAVVGTAIPELEERTNSKPPKAPREFKCSGIDAEAQCCATDILGLVNLDCAPVPRTPKSRSDFRKICASIGQRARCCVLPVLGQALICQAPN